VSLTPTPAAYPPLPSTVEAATAAIQAHIDQWRSETFPDAVVRLDAYLEGDEDEGASDAYLQQRTAIEGLGLDPDVLAPLPHFHKDVNFLLGVMTFNAEGVEAWLAASGFSAVDASTVLAALELIPAAVVEWAAEIVPGEVNKGDRVNVVAPVDPDSVVGVLISRL